MASEGRRKPQLIGYQNEVRPEEREPPSPPEYELEQSWPPAEERTESGSNLLVKVLAIIIAVTLANVLLSIFIIPQFTPVNTLEVTTTQLTTIIATYTTTTTTINYATIRVNASSILLGAVLEIVGEKFENHNGRTLTARIRENGSNIGTANVINGSFRLTTSPLENIKPGYYSITLMIDSQEVGRFTITVRKPELHISSSHVKVHDTLEVWGLNFRPGLPITICIDTNGDGQCHGEENKTVTPNQYGFFNHTLRIPRLPKGSYKVIASDGGIDVNATLSVGPRVGVNATRVRSGEGLKVTGTGFPANSSIRVQLCRGDVCYDHQESNTEEDGSFVTIIPISHSSGAEYYITVTIDGEKYISEWIEIL